MPIDESRACQNDINFFCDHWWRKRALIPRQIGCDNLLDFLFIESFSTVGDCLGNNVFENATNQPGEKTFQYHLVHPFSLSGTSTSVCSRQVCLIFGVLSFRPGFPFLLLESEACDDNLGLFSKHWRL